MASEDTRVLNQFRKNLGISFVLLISASVNGYLAHDLANSEPWIPIAKPDIRLRNKNNDHFNRRHEFQYNWKPTQEILYRNSNSVSENIITSLNSDDTSFSAANIEATISPQHKTEDEIIQDSSAFNITLREDPAIQDGNKLLPKPSNNIRKPRFQKQSIDSPNYINKPQMKKTDYNANKEIQPKIPKTNTENDLSNIKTNMYEVTENSNTTEDLVTEETIAKESIGYSYEKPLLELTDEPKINNDNTNLTSKFWNILAKYKINANDDLKNYELSRDAVLNQRKNNIYQLLTPLRAYRVPSGHNIQSNESLDRLFALFLSNYGYYLPQFYRIHGGYRNLYGQLAYNNLHNNKPFGPYKLF